MIGKARDGADALRMVHAYEPDALVLDVFMPQMGGEAVLHALHHSQSMTKVVILTARPSADLYDVIRREPDSILYKDSIAECDICEELVAVVHGEDSLGRHQLAVAAALAASRPKLNEREMIVLRRTAEGMQVHEIALAMQNAQRTVELHLHSIREKLEASTNAEAVAVAYKVGLVTGGPPQAK